MSTFVLALAPDVSGTVSLWTQLGFSGLAIVILISLALLFSSYVKIVTVLGIVRVGIGVHGLPSVFVAVGLALALSFFVMFPTLSQSTAAMDAVLKTNRAAQGAALEAGLGEWKKFVIQHTGDKEKDKFHRIAENSTTAKGTGGVEKVAVDPDSWRVLAPAFLVSELKEAFATGLSVFLPFLVIDLLVASVLVAVGLTQLSPIVVAFPFKLLLFVMVDGWALITTRLVATYL